MSTLAKSVCHITTLHPRNDVRIYHKECLSLSKVFNVYLLVADGKGNDEQNGIRIIDIGNRHKLRFKRILVTSFLLFKASLSLNCSLYHFHDSEFLLFGYILRKRGKVVIYDSHEDLPRQILGKNYIKPLFRNTLSKITEVIEDFFSARMSGIITATPTISERFLKINPNISTVCNFPSSNEFELASDSITKKKRICYVGGISIVRGIQELLEAIKYVEHDFELELVGDFEENAIRKSIELHPLRSKIHIRGIVERNEVKEVLYTSRIGIVALHPAPNHISALPVKMFEYMAAGIPVIASDFPLWKEVIEMNNCGICVNPLNPLQLADAINFLLNNPEICDCMGINGRRAVKEKYKWESEEKKLLDLYLSLA